MLKRKENETLNTENNNKENSSLVSEPSVTFTDEKETDSKKVKEDKNPQKLTDSEGFAISSDDKITISEDSPDYAKDIEKAIRNFEIAAQAGNAYAEYQLGRLFFFGNDVPKDEDKGMEYFKSSAEHGNEYAEKLINSIKSNRNWSAGLGALRLFRHLGRTIQNAVDERKKGIGAIDRKLRRQIEEKKQAHGLKHE